MLTLPNNCRASKIAVFPRNWKTISASIRKAWYIHYRFYDDNLNQSKKIIIKGMNQFDSLRERRDATQVLMNDELDLIQRQGYNRITNVFSVASDAEITGFTPFIEALEFAFETLKAERDTRIDVASFLKYFIKSIRLKGYDQLPIKDITKKHLKLALDECGKIKLQTNIPIGKTGRTRKGIWNANQYNHYRKYLSVLMTQLVDLDAMDHNPVEYIGKQKTVKKIRTTLTLEERNKTSEYLKNKHYSFWRFLQIFFHSGSRIKELLQVKKSDVDLTNQRFKITVKKGKGSREEYRTIKTVAMDYWGEICEIAVASDFLFSSGLKPGPAFIRREQITRRWNVHVKQKLGITADFYSLKHSNLDDIAAMAGIKTAQEAAGHSTPVITMIYATGELDREHTRLKDIGNTF